MWIISYLKHISSTSYSRLMTPLNSLMLLPSRGAVWVPLPWVWAGNHDWLVTNTMWQRWGWWLLRPGPGKSHRFYLGLLNSLSMDTPSLDIPSWNQAAMLWQAHRDTTDRYSGQQLSWALNPQPAWAATTGGVSLDILPYCSVTKSCLTLCDSGDCSTPGFLVLYHIPELAQVHIHWVGDAIQPSHPLLSPSPPALSLSQHQGLFQ